MDSMVLTALLEAVSVLAGVLIAFSIDAAWDNRRDRGREKGYLSALAAEIETNRERFCGYLDQLQSQLHTGDRALREIVFAQGTVDPGAVRGWLQSTGALYLELPEQAALSDILSSGGVAFIEDPGVRRLISRYSDALGRQRASQDNITMQWNAHFIPYTTRHCSLYDMVGGVPWNDGWVTPGLGSFGDDTEAFVANRDFANLIVHRIILVAMARDATDRLLVVIDELSGRLVRAA